MWNGEMWNNEFNVIKYKIYIILFIKKETSVILYSVRKLLTFHTLLTHVASHKPISDVAAMVL